MRLLVLIAGVLVLVVLHQTGFLASPDPADPESSGVGALLTRFLAWLDWLIWGLAVFAGILALTVGLFRLGWIGGADLSDRMALVAVGLSSRPGWLRAVAVLLITISHPIAPFRRYVDAAVAAEAEAAAAARGQMEDESGDGTDPSPDPSPDPSQRQ